MTPVVVRASVRARLLGLPLLHLDADVVVQPVEARAVVEVESGPVVVVESPRPAVAVTGRPVVAVTGRPAVAVTPGRPAVVPDGTLTDAAALLADATRTLARTR